MNLCQSSQNDSYNIYENEADISPFFCLPLQHTLCGGEKTAEHSVYCAFVVLLCWTVFSVQASKHKKILLKCQMTSKKKKEDLRSIKSTFAVKNSTGTEQRREKKWFDHSVRILCQCRTNAQLQLCLQNENCSLSPGTYKEKLPR